MSITDLFNNALLSEASYANFWDKDSSTVIKDPDSKKGDRFIILKINLFLLTVLKVD